MSHTPVRRLELASLVRGMRTPVQIEVQLKVKDLGGLVTQRRSLRLVTHTCPNRSTAEGEGLGRTCHTKEELETCHTHLSKSKYS